MATLAEITSLLDLRRCCFFCLQREPLLQVRTLAATRKKLRLTKTETAQLSSLRTLPGTYLFSVDEPVFRSRTRVVSLYQATSIARRQSHPLIQTPRLGRNDIPKYNFMSSCALPYYNNQSGKVEHGISCAGCQLAIENQIVGSFEEDWAWDARDMVYAQDSFLAHFRWCKQAQLRWESSTLGKWMPPRLSGLARLGGYFHY